MQVRAAVFQGGEDGRVDRLARPGAASGEAPRPSRRGPRAHGSSARGRRVGRFAGGLLLSSLVACATAAAQPAAPPVPEGRQVFLTQCYGCHTLGAAGTPIAPDLSRIGARLSRDELERRIRDPRTHRDTAHMPRLELSESEIRALVAYLSELR
jgi:mono/diheme cytochrome c family protein